MRATGVFESFSKCRTPTAPLRYEPCTQFINVSQRTLHIYWQFSAMSHAIHKIVSKNAANLISYRGVRRITAKIKTVICEQAPNHGSYFAYARLCFRNFQVKIKL